MTIPARHVQVLACDDIGGTELMVVMLASKARAKGTPTDVITLAPPGPVTARLADIGIHVTSVAGSNSLATALRLAKVLRQRRYALINVYGFKASVIVRLIVSALMLRSVVLIGVQGLHVTETEDMGSTKARFAARVEKLLSGLADGYEANSEGAVAFLRSIGIRPSKLWFVPNGIELSSWDSSGSDRPIRGASTVLCTARFIPRKRQGDLLSAAAELERRGVSCQLVFAGDGPLLESCRELAADLEVHATFLGTLGPSGLRDAFQGADVFCLPSTWEGLPAAVLEAMAAGLPVVGTDVNGIRDLVEDGVTGALVPPRSPIALADALMALLQDATAIEAYGRAGREKVERLYSADAMVDAKLALYDSLLASH